MIHQQAQTRDKNNSVTLLGTGTCQIEVERMASSALIEFSDARIVYDMGRGVTQRLVELHLKHDDIDYIIISHFHPDHISDLVPFLQAANWSQTDPRTKPLTIVGPPGIKELYDNYVRTFGEASMTGLNYELTVEEISADSFTLGTHEFSYVELPPAGNRGISFMLGGKRYGLTGDSEFHDAEVAFLKEVDIAVIDSGHLKDEEIIQLAADANTPLIICSHLYRELNLGELNGEAQSKGYTGEIVCGFDGMVLTEIDSK